MFKVRVEIPFDKMLTRYTLGDGIWYEMTEWIQENAIGNWTWIPGNPGHFDFDFEEDRVKFILRWL